MPPKTLSERKRTDVVFYGIYKRLKNIKCILRDSNASGQIGAASSLKICPHQVAVQINKVLHANSNLINAQKH